MLQKLYIRNYAIIDDLTIEFHPRFNIITGETGAGKSILIGALGLVLGNRADTSVLYDEGQKCFVEASFAIKGNLSITQLLASQELDEEDTLVVRREIAISGKSRSFINDTPVTLNVLRLFASQLADLHQQFDSLELGNDSFQRNAVDALAAHTPLLRDYKAIYGQFAKLSRELAQLKEKQANANKEMDYFRFLFDELEEAGFTAGEIEQLEEEAGLLSNAENIKLVLASATDALTGNEQPIVQQLRSLVVQMHSLKNIHTGIATLAERLQSAHIELKDIASELESINSHIGTDAGRLQQVNERIDKGYKLLKKHNAANTDELLAIKTGLEEKLDQVLNLGHAIEAGEKELGQLTKAATGMAHEISANRQAILPEFEKTIKGLLTQMGMPNAILKVRIDAGLPLSANGTDEIQFQFDANKSGRFEPLEKVASGGELSRLMLAIKSIVAKRMQMPTLIFDEIDTGISGEAARQVGSIMKELAQQHQVISITHQPQIAARAEAHFFVYKKEKEGRIKTQVRLLKDDERIDKIAQMLSGEQITESALQTAKEMVGRH